MGKDVSLTLVTWPVLTSEESESSESELSNASRSKELVGSKCLEPETDKISARNG